MRSILSPLFVELFMTSSILAGGASLAWGQRLTVTNVTKSEGSGFLLLGLIPHADES